jgi:hypothetical protein
MEPVATGAKHGEVCPLSRSTVGECQRQEWGIGGMEAAGKVAQQEAEAEGGRCWGLVFAPRLAHASDQGNED